jgi:DNA/RNA endonuclease G (NUC1)
MNDGARDLVSAMLAIAYASVLLVIGELYITSRSTELPTIYIKQNVSVPQAFHAVPAAP